MHRIATRQKFSRKTKIFAEFLTKKNPFFFHQKIKNSKFLPKNSAKKSGKIFFRKLNFLRNFPQKKTIFFAAGKLFFRNFTAKFQQNIFAKTRKKFQKSWKILKTEKKFFFWQNFGQDMIFFAEKEKNSKENSKESRKEFVEDVLQTLPYCLRVQVAALHSAATNLHEFAFKDSLWARISFAPLS